MKMVKAKHSNQNVKHLPIAIQCLFISNAPRHIDMSYPFKFNESQKAIR